MKTKINKKGKALVPPEVIENKILFIRGKKVMMDSDLANIYGVGTKVFNQAVKRNMKRFPEDFMFKLTLVEKNYVVTNCDHLGQLKYSPYRPHVFTEQGVAMLSSVLNSERAIKANIQIIRTFVKLREMIINNKELRLKIEEMERKYDKRFIIIFDTLRKLLENNQQEKTGTKELIGFKYKK